MNRMIHGDTTKELGKLITEGIKVDTIITDPPYGVGFKSHYDDSKEYVFSNTDQWFKDFYSILNDKGHMFVFVPIKEIHRWIEAGIKAGFRYNNIVSTKAHFIGSPYKPKNQFSYEFQPILHFSKGVGRNFEKYDFIKTSKSWYKDKRNNNPKKFTYVYSNYIDKGLGFANTKSVRGHSTESGRHPNEKNIDILKFLVGISTKPGETVFDGFAGSGSTGLAAIELGRDFIGIEQDLGYYESTKFKLEEALKGLL